MLYLIDGYNFLFRLQSSVKNLKTDRTHFLLMIDKICEKRNLSTQIIFDSSEALSQDYPSKAQLSYIQLTFSPKNKTADDYILEIIQVSKARYKLTVVTSDILLARQVEGLGSKWLTIENFMLKFFPDKADSSLKEEAKPDKETDRDFTRLLAIFEQRFHHFDPFD